MADLLEEAEVATMPELLEHLSTGGVVDSSTGGVVDSSTGVVDLSCKRLTDADVLSVACALRAATSVTSLDLRYSDLAQWNGNDTVICIMCALCAATSVTSLDLRYRDSAQWNGNDTVMCITCALRTATSITSLDLRYSDSAQWNGNDTVTRQLLHPVLQGLKGRLHQPKSLVRYSLAHLLLTLLPLPNTAADALLLRVPVAANRKRGGKDIPHCQPITRGQGDRLRRVPVALEPS
eukprot:1180096-Prorocentrum_minimum.AAC.1